MCAVYLVYSFKGTTHVFDHLKTAVAMAPQSSPSCSVAASLACCLLIVLCIGCNAQDVETSSITLPLDPTEFPELADRLPTPKEGWSFANTEDLTSSRLDTTTGVIRLVVQ